MKNQNSIRLALKDKGYLDPDIARMTGYCTATVANVIRRTVHTLVVQDAIAAILEIDAEVLWGLDYHARARQLRRNTDVRFDRFRKRYTGFTPQTRGDRIRKTRYAKQLRLEELAEATGIDITVLSRYERGNRKPSPKTCERIGLALGVDPQYLLFGEDEPNFEQPPAAPATATLLKSEFKPAV